MTELSSELLALLQNSPGSLRSVVEKIHELAKVSSNVYLHPHVKDRMREKHVVIQHVLHVLRKGEGVKGPYLDDYNDWAVNLRLLVAGEKIEVVVVLKDDLIEVITVFK